MSHVSHVSGGQVSQQVDFDDWLTWECDSWSRAEHVVFEAIDTCIVWLT